MHILVKKLYNEKIKWRLGLIYKEKEQKKKEEIWLLKLSLFFWSLDIILFIYINLDKDF